MKKIILIKVALVIGLIAQCNTMLAEMPMYPNMPLGNVPTSKQNPPTDAAPVGDMPMANFNSPQPEGESQTNNTFEFDIRIDNSDQWGVNFIAVGVDRQKTLSINLTLRCTYAYGNIVRTGNVIGLPTNAPQKVKCVITAVRVTDTNNVGTQYQLAVPYLEFLGSANMGDNQGTETDTAHYDIPVNLLDGGLTRIPGNPSYNLPSLANTNVNIPEPTTIAELQKAMTQYYLQKDGEQSRIGQISDTLAAYEQYIKSTMLFQTGYSPSGSLTPEQVAEAAARMAERARAVEYERRRQIAEEEARAREEMLKHAPD